MKPIDPSSRALLDAANRERTPDTAARARVLAGVLAAGLAGSTLNAKAASRSVGTGAVKLGAGLAHSLLLTALGVSALVGTYVWATRAHPAREAHAVAAAPPSAVASTNGASVPAGTTSAVASAAALPRALPTVAANAARATNPGSVVASAAPPLGALDRELSLLRNAHAAYRAGHANKALQLAEEHARLFPRSQLAAERQTIEVLSLCALGRTREARTIASRLRAASGSPSLAGLADTCAAE